MAAARKFGPFTGVFTPSVLTILGVIMYLRLPWIVGQGGILLSIGIIGVAHIISVTTGLSVSSIATDKRVKAGGTYYMISRSLGLPIGGTLGLALFVGLSFSVSLYLIGFSESFLSFWNVEVTRNTIRIAGSITLLVVTTVTFISTALALKTQYYILTAIVLSLVVIFAGRHDLGPVAATATSTVTATPFIVLFGIFFPAVTGFEAGVSMSGDLRDPKRAIPVGTIAAIVVGLAVYIALAVFLGRTVNADTLRNNPNVLLDIALFPPFVVAGIWGATLSSALGSILGAPRILQATAVDRIAPRFLAKGHGKENEPRRAMLVTFAIAEAGILIGELDVIARVVSMFFITTYGFLNLTAAIESWVSPDFRPTFRVPKIFPIIGATACFVVMIQLDLLAMIGSTIVLGAVYLYLTRKQLTLESGDTWEGVWSSVARSAMRRLAGAVTHRRNWRPNILQFGDPTREPQLLEFGGTLAERRGMLTNVHIVSRKVEYPRRMPQQRADHEDVTGVFYRVVEAPDEYSGVANVAGLYGFSGIDPNTVMLGWPNDGGTDPRYASLIHQLASLDHNLLLLRPTEEHFGERKHVTVWWSGYGRNIGLAIALIRFLTTSDDWPLTTTTFLVVNNGDISLNDTIARGLRIMLDEHRVDGTIKVIANGLEQRSLSALIARESKQADLTILGLPERLLPRENTLAFVAELMEHTGTTLLIRASSFFADVSIIPRSQREHSHVGEVAAPALTLADLEQPKASELVAPIRRVDDVIQQLTGEASNRFIGATLSEYQTLLDAVDEAIETTSANIRDASAREDRRKLEKTLGRVHGSYLFRIEETLDAFAQNELVVQRERLLELTRWYKGQWEDILKSAPEIIRVDAAAEQGKTRRRFRPHTRRTRFRRSLETVVMPTTDVALLDALRHTAGAAHDTLGGFQSLFRQFNDGMVQAEAAHRREGADVGRVIDEERAQAQTYYRRACDLLLETRRNIDSVLTAGARNDLNRFVRRLAYNEASRIRRLLPTRSPKRSHLQDVEDVCQSWFDARGLELNEAKIAVRVSAFRDRLETIVVRATDQLLLDIDNGFVNPIRKIGEEIQRTDQKTGPLPAYRGKHRFEGTAFVDGLVEEVSPAIDELPQFIELPATDQSGDDGAIQLPVRDAVQFLVDMNFSAPVRDAVDESISHFDAAANAVRDVEQLAEFYINPTDPTDQTPASDSEQTMLESIVERLNAAQREVEQQRDNLAQIIDECFRTTMDELHTVALRRAATLLGRHDREKRGRAAIARFTGLFSEFVLFVRRRLVQLQYRRSEGILLARRLGLSGSRRSDGVSMLRDFVESLSPSPQVLTQLPSYYRQLFLGTPAVIPAGRGTGRSVEISQANELINRHAEGASGAIAITGPPRSGRSTFVQLLSSRPSQRGRFYHVRAPDGGTVDPDVFHQSIWDSLGRPGRLDVLMHSISAGSTIVFHDLELWWERRDGGEAVIEALKHLINRFGEKHLFLVTISDRTSRLLNRLVQFDQCILGVVECRPLDAEDLKDAILTRHESTGLTFTLNGAAEGDLGEWNVANLFTDFFRHSQGNVGDAMHTWVSHIDAIHGKTIALRKPATPNKDALAMLRPSQVALMIQIVLHRRITGARLARLNSGRDTGIHNELHSLQRMGFIQNNRDVLEINPFVEPHLVRYFAEARQI